MTDPAKCPRCGAYAHQSRRQLRRFAKRDYKCGSYLHDGRWRQSDRCRVKELEKMLGEAHYLLRECLYATCPTQDECVAVADVPMADIPRRIAEAVDELRKRVEGLEAVHNAAIKYRDYVLGDKLEPYGGTLRRERLFSALGDVVRKDGEK